jgi:hypothetical protein
MGFIPSTFVIRPYNHSGYNESGWSKRAIPA